MNRSVLIVTPFFAPQSHAAVFRAYKLAKYLPRYGWKPYVLTVDTNYNYNEDPTLLEALPPEVEIHRARYIEPSLRGIRMALGGRDRTFLALKRAGLIAAAAPRSSPQTLSWTQRGYRYLLERWLRNPDAYWTWYRPALRKARELVRRYQIPLVFTSADPYTSHRIGLALQREGCRWVTDLRDPHAYSAETSSLLAAVRRKQLEIEREAVTKADAVTTASGAISLIVTDMYGLKEADRIRFIPVGVDEELLPPPDDRPLRPWPYLLFCGEYLDRYGTEFMEIFAEALRIGEGSQLAHRLLVIGREEVNRPRVLPAAERFGIADRIEFLDHMPQQELYRFVRGATFALLPGSRTALWWCLPAKLADYIFLRKHVIAVLPDPSEARTRLLQANLGIFLDGDRGTCADTLMRALTGRLRLPEPNEAECDRYSARRQVESFIGIFERLLFARHP